ncbi:MAG: carbohydrate kinase [Saprospiraceae bacterium]|nr:carbohydrate kinase [Saprospiraceae bacterium]
MSHILILDIGKTNKKAFVFNEDYRIVFEKSDTLPETTDDDGDPCEDLSSLTSWIEKTVEELRNQFHISAINVSAYGASFVHLGTDENPVCPLYNYLKPFPDDLKKQFFNIYGSEEKIALETASPVLGNLNSGLQLYWIKHRKPLIFNQIKWSLHLPQYVSWVVGRKIGWFDDPAEVGSDLTSLGCHTMLWDFRKNDYHGWVKAEGILAMFPPISNPPKGLHDSSAALIPYLTTFKEPFVLISTGTWCISMNPFNDEPLTAEELAQDCLCYLSFEGKPVKAARFFGGHEHEEGAKAIAKDYGLSVDFYKYSNPSEAGVSYIDFYDAMDAYSNFMKKLVEKQVASTRLAIGKSAVRRIFVDGGFSKNKAYMQLLAEAFPELEIYAAEVPQATALGAALSVHAAWNPQPIKTDLVRLTKIT